uniref:Uncharacterized protein n=1 Tax=Rhizophora mucronata TaxID=61149 RepID=A0A2P2QPE4_RHIMU
MNLMQPGNFCLKLGDIGFEICW